MNDENKEPVPDEAQASPAHAEDDIATLEREARAKREAELLSEQDGTTRRKQAEKAKTGQSNRLSCHYCSRAYLSGMGG